MKFGKRMDAEAVPEWRPKYVQYRHLKKLLKKIPPAPNSPVLLHRKTVPVPSTTTAAIQKTSRAGEIDFDALEKRLPRSLLAMNDCEELHKHPLTSEEQAFFELIEQELAKVDEFYNAREKEAIDRKFKIMAQLRILPEKKKKAKGGGSTGSDEDAQQATNAMTWRSWTEGQGPASPTSPIASSSNNAQTVSGALDAARPPSVADEEGGLPEHLQISSLRRSSFTSLARLRIKKALLEFYRSLELVRNYRTLNLLAFAKILKKYDKITQRRLAPGVMEKIRKYAFASSAIVDSLLADVENIYRWVFTQGDRTKALRKLRVADLKSKSFHGSAMFTGLVGGLILALIWRVIRMVIKTNSLGKATLAAVYAGLALPFLMLWLFAINSAVWETTYINYRFIFEFNQRNHLHVCEYLSVVGVFSLLYAVFVNVSVGGVLDAWVRPFLQPWLILGGLAALLCLPFPVFFSSTRKWFAKVMMRIVIASFYPVRFKDFFINDQLMSLVFAFQAFGALIYFTRDPLAELSIKQVRFPAAYYITALALLPSTWRILQCFRRYRDTKMWFPHIANLIKYLCSFSVPICQTILVLRGIQAFYWIAIAAQLTAAIYSLIWDVVMDFGLWKSDARSLNPYLRDTLLFKPAAYYYLIVSDAIARFLWIIPLVVAKNAPPTFPIFLLTLSLAIIEVLRRFQWNFFRVEYEHVNNCNGFKAIQDVQLPFTTADLFYHDMVAASNRQALSPSASDGSVSPLVGDDVRSDDFDVDEEMAEEMAECENDVDDEMERLSAGVFSRTSSPGQRTPLMSEKSSRPSSPSPLGAPNTPTRTSSPAQPRTMTPPARPLSPQPFASTTPVRPFSPPPRPFDEVVQSSGWNRQSRSTSGTPPTSPANPNRKP